MSGIVGNTVYQQHGAALHTIELEWAINGISVAVGSAGSDQEATDSEANTGARTAAIGTLAAVVAAAVIFVLVAAVKSRRRSESLRFERETAPGEFPETTDTGSKTISIV